MKIPEYNSSSGLNPTPADPNLAGQTGKNIAAVGQGISDLGDKFQEVQDHAQTTQAEVNLYKTFNDINQQAASDPDIWNAPAKYTTMMQKAVDETARGIQSASARSTYKNSASIEMAKRSVATNNMIRSRQLQEAKGKVLEFGDVKADEFANSASDSERQSIRQQVVDKVQQSVTSGIIAPDAATQYLKTHLDKMTDGQVEHDLSLDGLAPKVLDELNKGNDGVYKDISEEKRNAFKEQAKRVVEKQKNQAYELHGIALNKAESDLTHRYLSGDLNVQDVVRARIGGRISKEFYDSVVKADQSPNKSHHSDAKTYMNLVDEIHTPGSDPSKLRQKILDLTASGKISQTDGKHLYTANMMVNEEGDKTSIANSMADSQAKSKQQIIDADEQAKVKLKEQQNNMNSPVALFKKWASEGGRSVKELASMTQELFKKSPKPEDALGLGVEMVRQKTLQENPDFSNFPKEGQVVMNKSDGKLYLAKPNGDLWPYNGK